MFSELLLWGWLHRLWVERRLATATELIETLRQQPDGPVNIEQRARALRQLAAAVEAQDAYTSGHSRRVARHAAVIAGALGLTREEADRIQAGTHLDANVVQAFLGRYSGRSTVALWAALAAVVPGRVAWVRALRGTRRPASPTQRDAVGAGESAGAPAGPSSTRTASGPGGTLPFTGLDLAVIALLGGALITSGAIASRLSRPRPARRPRRPGRD